MTISPAQTAAAATPAVLRRRMAATGIDAGLLALVWWLTGRLWADTVLRAGVVMVVAVAVFAIVAGETGRSPGKAAMRLRLVNDWGRPPGAVPAGLRLLAAAVDYLPCLPVMGPLLIWFSPTHQRIGDTVTRTYVVPDEGVPEEPAPTGPAPTPYRGEGDDDEVRTDFKPLWDAKVNAYVQWDPATKQWMRYDEDADSWDPVEAL